MSIIGAGRTDSGVHAAGQVISFDLVWRHGTEPLLRAANANLPEDIAFVELTEAPPEFHPRFDARRRAYQYHIYNQPTPDPLRRLYSWHITRQLNVEAMNAAAACLVGVHDFATFGQPPQGENSVREIFHAVWRRQGDLLTFDIEGNAFLYRMVRSMVGSLRAVGDGQWRVADFKAALAAKDRARAATTAPAHGLVLVSVRYD